MPVFAKLDDLEFCPADVLARTRERRLLAAPTVLVSGEGPLQRQKPRSTGIALRQKRLETLDFHVQ